jgi:hypothetical protein
MQYFSLMPWLLGQFDTAQDVAQATLEALDEDTYDLLED